MIKDNEFELKKINKRTNVLLYIILSLFLFLTINTFYLQKFEYEYYSEKSTNNMYNNIEISPKRGNIYDRDGVVIANNRAIYDLVVTPEKISGFKKNKKESVENLFKSLSQILDIKNIKIEKKSKEIIKSLSFKDVLLLSDLNEEQLSVITSNLEYIDGVSINAKYVRNYPFKDLYLPLLGYVGRVSKDDLKEYKELNILRNDFLGKIGLEKKYNDRLYGNVGVERVMINASGKIIKKEKINEPISGEDINLGIDHDLQKIAYEELTKINKKGAVVAVDLTTGELLTFFSNPTYDANKFVKGITTKEYNKYFREASPLFNRVIQGQYPPASTIKPFMGMAAIEGEFIDPEKKIYNGPYYSIGKQKFRDWKRSGHGKLDMIGAISRSSDVYFYKIAHDMGIDYIHDFLSYFGYGKSLNIGLPNEKSGLLPSNEWKKRVYKEPFYSGDTVIVGIGQGAFLATPIQMLNSVSMLALNGKQIKFNFEKTDNSPDVINELKLSENTYKIAKEGMYDVIHGKGTSRAIGKKINFIMAGKTGTAQVFSTKGEIDYENEDMPEELKDHGLFVSYAPYDNPKIAVAVIVEHGEGGSSAAPIAVKIMQKYLFKNNLIEEEVYD